MGLIMELTAMAGLALAVCWLLCRAARVLRFRRRLSTLGRQYADRNPGSMFGDWFARKHGFAKMLFSTRSLMLSEWYSAEELGEIWYTPAGLTAALRNSGIELSEEEWDNG